MFYCDPPSYGALSWLRGVGRYCPGVCAVCMAYCGWVHIVCPGDRVFPCRETAVLTGYEVHRDFVEMFGIRSGLESACVYSDVAVSMLQWGKRLWICAWTG